MGIVSVVGPTSLVYDLATVEALNVELGLDSDTASDALVATQITSASKLIADFCGWSDPPGSGNGFAQREISELFRRSHLGRHDHLDIPLVLSAMPVVEISSITIDDTELDPADYEVDASGLIFSSYWRHHYWTEIVVEYTAGFDLPDQSPAVLQRACIELIRQQRFNSSRDPGIGTVRSIQTGDSRVEYWQGTTGGTAELVPQDIANLLKTSGLMRVA